MKNIYILTVIVLFLNGCNNDFQAEKIEDRFNIYISKLSNEEIEYNLSKGLKPIAIKDNIDVKGFANTAGSIALKDNRPSKNAFLIQQLVDNGYFVIGKTNLSEWANFRSSSSTSGWSSMGGQTINPYGSMRTPCGSSSGSGVVVATGLIDVAIGTETNGSVSCPSSVNGIVGIKPTVGLVSRSGIIPISHTQDTAGSMGRSVEKAAEILEIIAGKDINDPATLDIPEDFNFDFTSNLNEDSLKGKRFGLLSTGSNDKDGEKALQKIKKILENSGAIVVNVQDERQYPGEAELLVLMYEFKENLEKYLATSNSPYKTLSELIAFNDANKEKVLKYFDQSIFIDSDKTSSQKEEYLIALDQIIDTRNGIDKLLEENNVDALVGLSWSPAWAINHDGGDDEAIAAYRFWVNGSYAAMAGYPHITVPLDYIDGLPIGMSFIGTAWSDKKLIEYAYSFEQLNNFNPKPAL
jgi:Asp-tRNA(Asn)/Glu-tRNA(Gln) amidotransferase A subunit family amidase